MAGFATNFQSLKSNGAIPDIDEKSLPQNVRDVIETLSDAEIDALGRIAKQTGSYVTLHNRDHQFAVTGL